MRFWVALMRWAASLRLSADRVLAENHVALAVDVIPEHLKDNRLSEDSCLHDCATLKHAILEAYKPGVFGSG
jgi:hypothetical protein